MLLHVEDLADECDRRAAGDGSKRMHSGGKSGEALAGEDASDVEERQHGHHKRKARERRNVVPVRRDEEQNARAEKNTAKNQSENYLPASTAGLGLRLLIAANRGFGCFIQKPSATPTNQKLFKRVHLCLHNSTTVEQNGDSGTSRCALNCAAHVSHIRRGVRGAWIVQ